MPGFLLILSFFVAAAQPADEPEGDADGVTEGEGTPSPQGRPYTLDVCAVSGETLGSMGDPVVKAYDGREIKFCCEGCLDEFEANVPAGLAKVDEAMIAQHPDVAVGVGQFDPG